MLIVFTMAALAVALIVTIVGGIAALPLAVGALSILVVIVAGFRGLVRWFSGEPPIRG